MAKIVTITNPLTGQPAQVDQLDHTAQQIDDGIARALPGGAIDLALSTKVNENLLDNSVLLPGCLVDQRGGYVVPPGKKVYITADEVGTETSNLTAKYWKIEELTSKYGKYWSTNAQAYRYVAASDCVRGYTVGNTGPDRWIVWGGSITITDSGITPDATGSILQFIEHPIDSLLGRMVCATILWSDGTLTTGSSVAPSVFSGATVEVSVAGICNFGFSRRENAESPYLFVNLSLVGKTAEAIKLELGDTQTLAHQDSSGKWVLNELPNYADTLARCQRYFQTFATESLRPTDALDFRPVMRANPALSTITVNGKTLYTASADL